MDAPDIITDPDVFDLYFTNVVTPVRERDYYRCCLRWNTLDDAVVKLSAKCLRLRKGKHPWYNKYAITNKDGLTMYGQICSCGLFRVVSEEHLKEQAPPMKLPDMSSRPDNF